MASSGDENPQKQVDEIAKPSNEGQQDSRMESSNLSSPSVFVNSEPMREDQVENAVKFLSHPRVRGSPVIYRRSFLEKKGLTKEEIDEAFRRVPDPSPSVHATNVNQDGQVRSTSNVQQPGPVQTLQPSAATPGAITTGGTLSRTRLPWYHAVMAVGLLAVSGAGTAVFIKNTMVPRLKAWIRKVAREGEEEDLLKENDSKPSLAEEAAAAAKAAAAAASDVAKTSQELLKSRYEEKKYFEDFTHKLDVQVQEMKSMSTAIHKLEGRNYTPNGTYLNDQEDNRESAVYHKQAYANGKFDHDSRSARSSSPPVSADPSVAPHPKSYMEIMAMLQRGERPSNIRDINDQPPNPSQQILNPRLAPRAKPWEVGQVQSNSTQVLQTQLGGEGLSSKVQENGVTYQFNEESNAPWWERKNARITEIENEDELKDNKGQAPEQQVQRTWVPPLPPSVVMPEAAEAIRRPKSSVKKEQQLADVTDELERVTKVAESGSTVETNGGGSGLTSSEIQEEHNDRVE